MTTRAAALRAVRDALARHGLLLEVDARRPSVTTIVAGEPVRGSWWGHRAGKLIYDVLGSLSDEEAISVPLVDGKATLVHRSLWPSLLGVAMSGESWQTEGLSAPARRLLDAVASRCEVRADRPPDGWRLSMKEIGDLVRDLERRLLVRGSSIHIERGAHAAVATSWAGWAASAGLRLPLAPVEPAKDALEAVVGRWAAGTYPAPSLPWLPRPRTGRRSAAR